MIHLIITAANIPEYFEKRKSQYIESIASCLQFAHLFDSYTILECVADEVDYLKDYNVYYSKAGNSFSNKGLNEMQHIKAFLEQSAFSDTDAIIKLTGRYLVEESYFFERVLELHQQYDGIFKNDDDVYVGNGYHTFFYYMKKGLFLKAIASLEFSNANDRPIEWDVKEFLLPNDNHVVIDKLGVMAYQGTASEKIFRA
jgi:hypothetical protein